MSKTITHPGRSATQRGLGPARRGRSATRLSLLAAATLALLTSLLAIVAPTPASAQGTYTPMVSATVPFVNDGDGNNVYSGTEIVVEFTKDPNNAPTCPSTPGFARARLTIENTGTTPSRSGSPTAGECSYIFEFPDYVPASGDATRGLVRTTAAMVTASGSSATVSATYEEAVRIVVQVPFVDDGEGNNVFSGTAIEVAVAAGSGNAGVGTCPSVGAAATDPADNPDIVTPITFTIGNMETMIFDVFVEARIPSGCSYVLTFPEEIEASGDNTKSIVRESPETVTADDGTTLVSATYFEQRADVPINITVPFVDNGAGVNVYSGTVINVEVTPDSGNAAAGCATIATPIAVTIGDTGTLAAGAVDAIGTGCSYDFAFPNEAVLDADGDRAMNDPDDRVIERTSAATFTATEDTQGISAAYRESPATFLGPEAGDTTYTVAIRVPMTNYNGVPITVTFVPTATSPAGCPQGGPTTVVAQTDGTTVLATGSKYPRLVDKPLGFPANARCVYELTFATGTLPPSVAPLLFEAPPGTNPLSHSDTTYEVNLSGDPDTLFTPSPTITAPAMFENTVIVVTYTKIVGSDPSCPLRGPTEEYTVGSGGSTTRTSGAAVELVDEPGGSPDNTHCSYNVTFEAPENRTYGGILSQTPQTLTGSPISAAAPAYTAVLQSTGDTVFFPMLSFAVGIPPDAPDGITLDDYVDEAIQVDYTAVLGSNDVYQRCTASDREFYVLKLEGSGDAARLVAEFDTARDRNVPAVLIDRPEGPTGNLPDQIPAGTACRYDVSIQYVNSATIKLDPPEFFLLSDNWVATSTTTAPPSAGDATHFTPTVNIDVPDDSSAPNTYRGIQFNVSFAPVATANAGCSPATTSVYQVDRDAAGTVEVADSSVAARLVNLPAGGTVGTDECSYDATIALADSRENRLMHSGSAPGAVSAAADTVSDTWVAGDGTQAPPSSGNATKFDAELRIYVPDNTFAGIQFTVAFAPVAGSQAGCSPATSVIYEVDSNGEVGVAGFNKIASLVYLPAGGDVYDDECSYDVTIAPSDSREMRLIRDGSAPTAISQVGVSAAAHDLAGDAEPFFDTTFTTMVSFTFTVPEDVPDRVRPRDFAGQLVTVSYVPDRTIHMDCAASSTESYALMQQGAGASATLVGALQGESAVLVDHPGDPTVPDDTRCSYRVSMSYADPDVTLAPPRSTPAEVSAMSNVVVADIQPLVFTTFEPTTVFTLPTDYETAGYGATVIVVSYSIASGSAFDCTAGATETFDVAADGTYTSRGDLGRLANAIPAQEDSCSYVAVATKYIAGGQLGRLTVSETERQIVNVVTSQATFEYTAQTTFSTSTSVMLPADFTGSTVDVGYSALYQLGFDVTLPFIDAGDGTNVFEGTEITANVSAAAGNPSFCSSYDPPASLSGTVGASSSGDGTATLAVAHADLIPAACAYVLTFVPSITDADPGHMDNTMTTATPVVPVNAGFPTAQVSYTSHTSFSPTINIVLEDNILTGLQFLVEFLAGQDTVGCSPLTEAIYEIGPDGTVGLPFGAQAVSLIDLPAGGTAGTDNCAYEISIELVDPRDVRLDRDPAGTASEIISSSTEVSAASSTVTDTWIILYTTFTPTVSITVPPTQTTPGTNDFAGIFFTVLYSPVSDAHSDCSGTTSAVYEVGTGGTVGLADGETAPTLVNLPAGGETGMDECSYDVLVGLTDAREMRLERSGSAPTTVSAAASTVADSWVATSTTTAPTPVAATTDFEPTVNLDVPDFVSPNTFEGIQFTVSFSPEFGAHDDCSSVVSVVYEIGVAGTVGLADGETAASLVNLPAGAIPDVDECTYDVFVSLVDPNEMRLARFIPVPLTTSAVASTVTTEWKPASDMSPVAVCTAGASETYEAAAAGSTTISGGTPAMLVDTPQGEVKPPDAAAFRCSYEILITDVTTVDRNLGGSPTITGSPIDASAPTAMAVFEAAAVTTFTGDIDIVIPAGYGGTTVEVTYTRVSGSDNRCTMTASETYNVANDRMVTIAGTAQQLIDTPEGALASVHCSYDVAFAITVVGGRLVTPPSVTGSPINAMANTASATYIDAPAINFMPTANISVPAQFGGTTIAVTYRRVSGSNGGCTATASESYSAADDRMVTRTGPRAQLVDTPAGEPTSVRCSYDVSFSATPPRGALASPTVTGSPIRAAAPTVSASYSAVNTTLRPMVVITVPPEMSGGANIYAGAEFTVMFSRVAGADASCTMGDTVVYAVLASGTVDVKSGETAAVLVDVPANQAPSCVYDVVLPFTDADLQLGRATNTAHQVSGASPRVTEQYGVVGIFEPDVTITFPDLDGVSANPNDFEGLQLTASYTPVSSADSRCRPGTETFTVDAAGLAVRDGAAVKLMGTPFGTSAECVYLVGLPARVQVPGADPVLDPADPTIRNTDFGAVLPSGDLLVSAPSPLFVAYLDPNARQEEVFDDSLYRVAGGKGDIDVRVAIRVPTPAGQIFGPRDTFEVHVNVPGICGDDTLMFGGPHASDGVSYGVRAVIPGVNYVIGPGSKLVNPRAAYTLPSYVERSGQTTPCQIRVTHVKAPVGCEMRASQTDSSGRAYNQITWTQGLTSYEMIMDYDCDTSIGRLSLVQGWMMLPFNGETGTTPQDLALTLRGGISSVWVWDAGLQNWRGWASGHGNVGLDQLTKGDIIVVYSPRVALIEFRPLDLFDPPAATGNQRMEPVYSLQVFGGTVWEDLGGLFGDEPGSILVLFRWDAADQDWEYYLPGRAPVDTVDIEWFDFIVPRDVVFAYNAVGVTVTVPWS